MYSIIVWYDPKKLRYYHKYIKGFASSYNIGDGNSYGHYIVYKFTLNHDIKPVRYNIKQRILNALLDELQKGD